MIITQYPQITEGYACRFEELHRTNRNAAIAAASTVIFSNLMKKDNDLLLQRLFEGRVLVTKLNGMVEVVKDETETPGSGRAFFDLATDGLGFLMRGER